MENKTDLHTKIKKIRTAIDPNQSGKIIIEKILSHPVFVNSQNIMLYYPLRYEINLLPLMNYKKNFYFPKVNKDQLLVCPACDKFEKSSFNVYEPCSVPVSPDVIDLVIVPALAVDKENYRLGYGGGFYDRFLALYPKVTSITPIFKQFIFDVLPREKFDIPVTYVISD